MTTSNSLTYNLRKQLGFLLAAEADSHTIEQLHALALQALKDVENEINSFRNFKALLEESE